MHNTNGKIVRAIATAAPAENRQITANSELNGNNIIFLRGAKTSDNGHILLRADSLNSSKTNLVLDDGEAGKLGQFFIQQGDLGEGVFLQSVKRLGGGTPILLFSGNDNGNGHILIQTTSAPSGSDETRSTVAEFVEENAQDNILVQALEGLKDNNENTGVRSASTPLGSGKFCYFDRKLLRLQTFLFKCTLDYKYRIFRKIRNIGRVSNLLYFRHI